MCDKNLNEFRKIRMSKDENVLTKAQSDYLIKEFSNLEIDNSDLEDYEVISVITDLTYYVDDNGINEDSILNSIDNSRFVRRGAINPSGIDSNPETGDVDPGATLIRYRYEGPTDSRNRDFCAFMMSRYKTDYFTRGDINRMSFSGANDEFGVYSIWRFKGSYGCRHSWSAYVFRLKETPTGVPRVIVRRSATDSSLRNPRPNK